MEANELMVGDWVKLSNEGFIPIKVQDINLDCIRCNYVYDSICDEFFNENIEPIPLTDEMLELNGFIDNRKAYWNLSFSYWDNGNLCINIDNGLNTLKITVKYVHELQHALRLCGLNNIADNFKLEE